MSQYIDKSALVTEIEKYYNECHKRSKITDSDYWNAKWNARADAYRNVLTILDETIEIKEVDLEKELDVVIDSLNDDKYEHLSIHQQLSHIARHFFELALKVKRE